MSVRFEPEKWNSSLDVLHYNNCYNYALNNTKVKAIDFRGLERHKYEARVRRNAIRDGLVPCSRECEVPHGYHKVCLVFGYGMHWYRQDDNGTWSHKPGSTKATGGIVDPVLHAEADGYTLDGGGFYLAPSANNR